MGGWGRGDLNNALQATEGRKIWSVVTYLSEAILQHVLLLARLVLDVVPGSVHVLHLDLESLGLRPTFQSHQSLGLLPDGVHALLVGRDVILNNLEIEMINDWESSVCVQRQ